MKGRQPTRYELLKDHLYRASKRIIQEIMPRDTIVEVKGSIYSPFETKKSIEEVFQNWSIRQYSYDLKDLKYYFNDRLIFRKFIKQAESMIDDFKAFETDLDIGIRARGDDGKELDYIGFGRVYFTIYRK